MPGSAAHQAPEQDGADDGHDQPDERQSPADHAEDGEQAADDGNRAGATADEDELIPALLALTARAEVRAPPWLQGAHTAAAVAPRPASSATRSRWSRAEP